MSLNRKQSRFVSEYLKDQNATQSAIRAGYSKKTAFSIGSENLKKPEIKAEVESRLAKVADKAQVTAEYVLNGLKNVADLSGARGKNGVKDSSGANRALELLGKYLKLFTDRVENSFDEATIERFKKAIERGHNAKTV